MPSGEPQGVKGSLSLKAQLEMHFADSLDCDRRCRRAARSPGQGTVHQPSNSFSVQFAGARIEAQQATTVRIDLNSTNSFSLRLCSTQQAIQLLLTLQQQQHNHDSNESSNLQHDACITSAHRTQHKLQRIRTINEVTPLDSNSVQSTRLCIDATTATAQAIATAIHAADAHVTATIRVRPSQCTAPTRTFNHSRHAAA